MKGFLTTISFWAGLIIASLAIIDWLLLESQKKKLQRIAEDAWLWLAAQRIGRFTSLLRVRKVQVGFSVAAHLMMALIVFAFLARVYWGIKIDAQVQLGWPRLYRFQVWVDILAIAVSGVVVSWVIHPRIANWLGSSSSLIRYFLKVLAAFVASGFLNLIITLPTALVSFSSPSLLAATTEAEIIKAHEQMLGGKIIVIAVHAVTAILAAPVMVESFLLMTILFLSGYWFIFVLALMALFKVAQFILLRVVDSPKGSVFGISGLLVAIAALLKLFL